MSTRSFRSKPVGWRGESYRHYLAAKGVSSTLKYMKTKDHTGQHVYAGVWVDDEPREEKELGPFRKSFAARKDSNYFAFKTDMPLEDNGKTRDLTEYSQFNDVTPRHKYRMFVRDVDPDEFLKLSKVSDPNTWKYTQKEWESADRTSKGEFIRRDKHIDDLKKAIKSKDKIVPLPHLIYDEDGNLTNWQEGRHRALAAKDLGMKTLPVAIGVKRTLGDRALDDKRTRLPLDKSETHTDYVFKRWREE